MRTPATVAWLSLSSAPGLSMYCKAGVMTSRSFHERFREFAGPLAGG